MKHRLIFWLDKVIYMLMDTLPKKEFDVEGYEEQLAQVQELEKIKKWIIKNPLK